MVAIGPRGFNWFLTGTIRFRFRYGYGRCFDENENEYTFRFRFRRTVRVGLSSCKTQKSVPRELWFLLSTSVESVITVISDLSMFVLRFKHCVASFSLSLFVQFC